MIKKMRGIAPCEERAQRHLELLSSVFKDDKSPEWWVAAGEIAKKDYWFFLRYILQYQWMDAWFHGEVICNFLEEYGEESCLVLIPRGHGKTGMVTVPRSAWWIARDPFTTCVILNAAEDKAAKFARTTAAIVSKNVRYRKCFPEVRPADKWGESGYFVDTRVLVDAESSVERTDPSLFGVGVGGNLTGSHYSKMIADDLINEEASRHPNKLKRIEKFFTESLNCLDPNEPLLVCGTRWREDDFYGKLEKGELEGNHGKIHVLKLGATDKDGNLIWPQTTYIDIRGVTRVAGFTKEKLESQKKNLGGLFWALYYNNPTPADGGLFETEFVETFTETPFDTSGVMAVAIEAESQGVGFVSHFRNLMREEGHRFRVITVDSKFETGKRMSKNERIMSNVQPLVNAGLLSVRKDIWLMEDGLGWEIKKYDKGHDDMIDALAYLINIVREPPKGYLPKVAIVCDPAFSVGSGSDYTAILVGCKYQGKVWVLDAMRFQTNNVTNISRMILKMHRKYEDGIVARKQEKGRFDTKISGLGHKPDMIQRGMRINDSNFTMYDPKRELLMGVLKNEKNE